MNRQKRTVVDLMLLRSQHLQVPWRDCPERLLQFRWVTEMMAEKELGPVYPTTVFLPCLKLNDVPPPPPAAAAE
jgi:hypothetical protein